MVALPSAHRRIRHAAGAVALAACCALLLAGCGAAEITPIPKAVGVGTNASARDVLIRNVFVLGPLPGEVIPRGGSAPLFVTFVNDGDAPDRLLSVSAPGTAGKATISGGGIDLPPRRLVSGGPYPRIMLEKLAKPLHGNETIPITMTFRDAGTVTMKTQVMVRTGPFATYAPSPSPSATSGSPTPSRTASRGTATGG